MSLSSSDQTIQRNIVFLFDVDNTLLDRDGFLADLKIYLEKEIGASSTGYGVNSVMLIILARYNATALKNGMTCAFSQFPIF